MRELIEPWVPNERASAVSPASQRSEASLGQRSRTVGVSASTRGQTQPESGPAGTGGGRPLRPSFLPPEELLTPRETPARAAGSHAAARVASSRGTVSGARSSDDAESQRNQDAGGSTPVVDPEWISKQRSFP